MPNQIRGYYNSRQEKLLKDFDRTSALMKDSLVKRYGEEFANILQKDVRQEYEKLIPEIPYIKGLQAKVLNSLFLITAQELATYKAMKKQGQPATEAWELCHQALRLRVAQIPRWKRWLLRHLIFSSLMKKIMTIRAKQQQKFSFGDFEIEYLMGEGDDFDLGLNCLQCGNHSFVMKHGEEEFAPFICMSDIVLSDALGWGLSRTQTLADGCHYCDFRFKKGAKTQISSKTPEVQAVIERIRDQEIKYKTKINQAQEALLSSERRYSTLAKIAPVGIFHTSATGHCLYVNERWCEIAGITPQEALGEGWSAAIHPEDRERVLTEWSRSVALNLPFKAEYRFRRSDARETWVLGQAMAEIDDSGNLKGYVGTITDISSLKQMEGKLEQTRNFLQTLIDHLPVALFVKDGQEERFGQLLMVNKTCEKLFGLNSSQVIGKTGHDLFPQEPAAFYEQKDREAFARGVPEDIPSETIDSYSLGRRILHTIKVPLYDKNHQPEYLLCISQDITEGHRAEEALRQNEQRFRALIENATDIIIILDNQFRFRYLSPSVSRILGYLPEELIDQSFWAIIYPDERQPLAELLNRTLEKPEINQSPIEYRCYSSQGTWRVLEAVITNLLDNPAVKGIVLNCHEITDRKQAESKLQYDALHDSLTDLPNRALLMEQLKQALKRQQRDPERLFGVLFLDLDRFKVINDSLGHLVGDQLLMALADRLEKCKRASDIVARLGGDEFVILLEELTSSESAIKVAERIHRALEKPFLLQNKELFVSASIGIALSSNPHDYSEPTQLLRDADTAMYQAKKRGKNCHTVFEPSMHTHAQKRLQLENDLRRAISHQELVVYYQPIFSLETNCLEGVEALVRWQHPEQGLIPPEDFIPMAEETGIIIALDQWVLKNACCQLCYWQEQFPAFSHLTLSVNLSGNHFSQMDFIEQIVQIIASTGILGQYLKLEITESVLLSNPSSTVKMLARLRKKNIQVCLDDFGTGYSSLSYLDRFPLNILKIDRSFVSNLEVKDSRIAIVRTIVTLGHELGIEVVAEGIETTYQMQFLKALGCHYGQGYYFSRPVELKTLTNYLETKVSSSSSQQFPIQIIKKS